MICVRAVVFDLDGTLFDHVGSARKGLRSWLSQSDVDLTDELETAWFTAEETHFESWRNGAVSWDEQRRGRLRDFLPLAGRPVGTDGDLDQLFRDGYLAAYEAAWVGYDDVHESLAGLDEQGFDLGVLTNGAEEQQRAKLARLGLLERVGRVFTAEGIGVAKPHPDAFLTVCSALGVPPDHVLYVGDDYEIDVVAARAAGLKAIHLDRFSVGEPGTDDRIATLAGLSDVVTLNHH